MANLHETLLFQNMARRRGELERQKQEDIGMALQAQQSIDNRQQQEAQQRAVDMQQAQVMGGLGVDPSSIQGPDRLQEMASIGALQALASRQATAAQQEREDMVAKMAEEGKMRAARHKEREAMNRLIEEWDRRAAIEAAKSASYERTFGPGGGRGAQFDVRKTGPFAKREQKLRTLARLSQMHKNAEDAYDYEGAEKIRQEQVRLSQELGIPFSGAGGASFGKADPLLGELDALLEEKEGL